MSLDWPQVSLWFKQASIASIILSLVSAVIGGCIVSWTQWRALRFQLKLLLLRQHINSLCVRIDGYSTALRIYGYYGADYKDKNNLRELEVSPEQIIHHLKVIQHLHKPWQSDRVLQDTYQRLNEGFKFRMPQPEDSGTLTQLIDDRIRNLSDLKLYVLRLEADLTAG